MFQQGPREGHRTRELLAMIGQEVWGGQAKGKSVRRLGMYLRAKF